MMASNCSRLQLRPFRFFFFSSRHFRNVLLNARGSEQPPATRTQCWAVLSSLTWRSGGAGVQGKRLIRVSHIQRSCWLQCTIAFTVPKGSLRNRSEGGPHER
ncbi:hypothetical protein L917_20814 [Phytophthora nicotianae]|uniref:Uncharacterized protein n=1 Tax=Phytophthora nicotianae TaxID=4792 RepID=W2JZR0_PHYNI|nr:hypothetical protein L917_20814 [Phytophthora nicotianae]